MSVRVEVATAADDGAIRALLRRQPLPGRVSLTFEREPCFATGCEITGDNPVVLVARSDAGDVVGVATRSVRTVYVNGCATRIGYLGQLRVDSRFRGRWLVARGFAVLREQHHIDPVPAYLAAIVDGSREATGVLVRSRRAAFPVFHQIATYRTLAVSARRVKLARASGAVTPASEDQLRELTVFLQTEGARKQLYPLWTIDALRRLAAFGLRIDDILIARRARAIVGVIAFWDQTAYKQSVVRSYSGWMKAASWLGGGILPRVGDHVRSAYAALVAIQGDDRDVFDALVREACRIAAARDFAYLAVGFDERDPLLEVARALPHIAYPSRLYLASWPNGVSLHEQLDQRPAYVDVATL